MVLERWVGGGRPATAAADQDVDDCFQCKLSGSIVFAGVAGYLLNERQHVPKANVSHRRFLLGFSVLFGTFSIGRWFARDIHDAFFREDPPVQ